LHITVNNFAKLFVAFACTLILSPSLAKVNQLLIEITLRVKPMIEFCANSADFYFSLDFPLGMIYNKGDFKRYLRRKL